MDASFSKSFRGYDVSQVDAYVQNVQNFELESQNALVQSNRKTAELEAEVARLREIESSLFRALKLAEESQQNFSSKMEKEAKAILDKANKEAESIKKKAEVEAQKQALLTENERKLTLAQASQELKEQERQLRNLQEAKKEIASQLKAISEQTLGSIANWSSTEIVSPIVPLEPTAATTPVKRGRKPGVKNKPKAKAKAPLKEKKVKLTPAAPKAKLASKVVVKAKPETKSKPVENVTPAKRGPKPKVKSEEVNAPKPAVVKAAKPAAFKKAKPTAIKVAKPVTVKKAKTPAVKAEKQAPAKRGPKPKISLETVTDEGLPTLNKVLEAYAKSTGPRGKVGEIN